jgi:hypothetical protein
MALQKREKILAVIAGACLAVGVFYYLLSSSGPSMTELVNKRASLQKEIAKKNLTLEKAKQAQRQLDAWQKCALPSDSKLAQTLYQTWLTNLIDSTLGGKASVTPGTTIGSRGLSYDCFTYKVQGVTNLEQLIRFLYDFYHSGHLHKISSLVIKPQENSSLFELIMDIQALSLPRADRRDKLTSEPGNRLKLKSLAEYQKPLLERKLFTAYVPPRPAPPPERPKEPAPEFDLSAHTYLTTVIDEENGRSEAWINIRPTGKTLRVHEGEDFNVGPKKYKVLKIHRRSVEVQCDGQTKVLMFDKSLKPESGEEKREGPEAGGEKREEKKKEVNVFPGPAIPGRSARPGSGSADQYHPGPGLPRAPEAGGRPSSPDR